MYSSWEKETRDNAPLMERMLNRIESSFQSSFGNETYTKKDITIDERKGRYYDRNEIDGYPFIPRGFRNLIRPLKEILQTYKRHDSPKFLDVGCGPGITLILASSLGYSASGIEVMPKVVEMAKTLTAYYADVIQADALQFSDYGRFDVIYYYCPLSNRSLEEQMEKRIEDQMKVGAWLFPQLKQFHGTMDDPRFQWYREIGAYYKVKD